MSERKLTLEETRLLELLQSGKAVYRVGVGENEGRWRVEGPHTSFINDVQTIWSLKREKLIAYPWSDQRDGNYFRITDDGHAALSKTHGEPS